MSATEKGSQRNVSINTEIKHIRKSPIPLFQNQIPHNRNPRNILGVKKDFFKAEKSALFIKQNACKAVERSWAIHSVPKALMRAEQTLRAIFFHNGYSLIVSNVGNRQMFALHDNQ